MVVRMEGGFVVTTQVIGVEDIFPRMTAARARFDFRQTDIAQSENAESLEERTRFILQREANRGFVRVSRTLPFSTDENESCEVLLVVFEARLQDLGVVFDG